MIFGHPEQQGRELIVKLARRGRAIESSRKLWCEEDVFVRWTALDRPPALASDIICRALRFASWESFESPCSSQRDTIRVT